MNKNNQILNYKTCQLCNNKIRIDRYDNHVSMKCEKRSRAHPFSDIFPKQEIPVWLKEISKCKELPKIFPLIDILTESCFYPASGLDASPVIIANGHVHSFIYCDYGIAKSKYYSEISFPGFNGYKKILQRSIEADEIVPENYNIHMPEIFDQFYGKEILINAQKNCDKFGDWTIWKRNDNLDDYNGPEYFSLIFLTGEGLATYLGLYKRNNISPKILSVIQPGHGFGGNWTNYLDENGIFWRTVINSEINPNFLLIGEYTWPHKEKECNYKGYNFKRKTYTFERDRFKHVNKEGNPTTLFEYIEVNGNVQVKGKNNDVRRIEEPGIKHTIYIYKKDS